MSSLAAASPRRRPDLKANGGPGLRIGLPGGAFANAIVCARGGGGRMPRTATDCAGQRLPDDGGAA